MELDELLEEIRSKRLILLQHGALWAPNTHVPLATRRAIRMHRRQLAQLIAAGDIAVCCSRDLHRQYFYHAGGGRYICEVCERIQIAV